MHILIVTQFLFPDMVGGAGRYIHELAAGLQARGHAVTIITPQPGGQPSEETRQDGVRVFRCPPLQHWWQVPGSWLAIRRLFHRLHRRAPFDLLVVQQALPAFPLVWGHGATRLPWVYHFQSPWAQESAIQRRPRGWDPTRSLGLWVRWAIEHRVLLHADCRITLSESMKQILLEMHPVPAASVQVIPAWVALSRFQPAERSSARARVGVPQEATVLLTVRGLVPRQNLDNLIRAMPLIATQHNDVQLYIGGAGPLEQDLRALIASLGLEPRVHLVGVIPDETLPQWYQAADVFIMPSKALEGFGLATLEALACGTPAIGTPIGGTKELLEHLDPTLLCAGIEPEAIAASILQTWPRLKDPRARQQLRVRCRAFALQFSRDTAIERIEQAYRRSARVRVLHVHTLPVISGSGLNTVLSMQGLPADRYEAALACAPGGALLELVEQRGMRVHRLRHMVWSLHLLHDPLVVIELWRLMRRHRYAIVHTHNSKAGFVGRLAAWLAGVPVIVHTVHGFAFHPYERWWKQRLYRFLERLAAHWCDRLIVISEPLLEWALRERIAPRAKMVKIYSGIDTQAFRQPHDLYALRAELGLTDQMFVVGEVAKLWAGKGHTVLLRAAARLKDQIPNLRVLIIGEGGLRSTLAELVRELGLHDRVILTGFREDIPPLTQLLDVAVLPTLFEGMGRAVLEAQAAGKPVVASRVGGIPDLITDGATGLLIDPGRVEPLAEAIRRLYDDPMLRRRLGHAAQAAVDGRFDAVTMAQHIQQVYEELIARHTSRAVKGEHRP